MDTIINLLNTLAPLVATLTTTGLLVKYLPWLKWMPNQLIPWLNALIVFVGAFGPTPAHAGFLGDLGGQFSFFGKAAASLVVSGLASWFYESHLRGPLEKLGLRKAT